MAVTLEDLSYRVLPRVRPGRALADSEWATLMRAAETLNEGSPTAVSPARVADNVERFLVAGRSRRAFRVRVLLTLLDCLPLVLYGRRFRELSLPARRRLVEERFIGGKHVWGLCAKVRLLVLVGTYGDKAAHPATGFVPIPLRARNRPRPVTGLEVAS